MNNLAKKLDEISECIINGKAMFFIGAGFSLDSEDNSAKYFMTKLLVRCRAMLEILEKGREKSGVKDILLEGKTVQDYARKLIRMFYGKNLSSKSSENSHKKSHDNSSENEISFLTNIKFIESVSENYYSFNEQMIIVFASLWKYFSDGNYFNNDNLNCFIDEIDQKECEIWSLCDKCFIGKSKQRPAKIDVDKLAKVKKFIGKFIFIETIGLSCDQTMMGDPVKKCYQKAVNSYGNIILPRHIVLARLALERFSPVLLTTNYDKLLEGAYRQLGFSIMNKVAARNIYSNIRQLHIISGPGNFTSYGHSHMESLIVKIHGCADYYKKLNKDDIDKYLPSLVYTYREIQNWREDHWAKEYLHTQIRTKSTIFMGYSASDHVIHDSFRSVYEELARLKEHATQTETEKETVNVAAYFFDVQQDSQFHGLELVRAASRIQDPEGIHSFDHENYINYNKRGGNVCPDIDDIMKWILHLVIRKQQYRMLRQHLSEAMAPQMGRPLSVSEINRLCARHEKLRENEVKVNENGMPKDFLSLESVCDWTYSWFPEILILLRERQQPTEDHDLEKVKSVVKNPLPCAAADYHHLAVKAILIEMALRHIVDCLSLELERKLKITPLPNSQNILIDEEVNASRKLNRRKILLPVLIVFNILKSLEKLPVCAKVLAVRFEEPHFLVWRARDKKNFWMVDLWKIASSEAKVEIGKLVELISLED